MRNFSNKIIFMLLLSSIVLPFLPVTAKVAPAKIPRFKIGVSGEIVGNWDGPVATAGYHADFGINALEPLMQATEDWSGDPYELLPVLATSWTLEEWPPEMNVHPTDPFINQGGLRAINITLRDNVIFHDGSAFNATVVKWNIDRMMVITGNITGTITAFNPEVTKARTGFYLNAEDWVDYETPTWNVSQFIGKRARYAEFGTSKEEAMRSHYCRIRNVTVIDEQEFGGAIRIDFNDWGGAGAQLMYAYDTMMISMKAYKNYFDIPIYGLGQFAVDFPQPEIPKDRVYPDFNYPSGPGVFPGHMIGTGPYIFIEQAQTLLQGGSMIRNPNWWNSTAAQAEGWHKVQNIGISYFESDAGGISARTDLMKTGQIHLAYDSLWDGNLIYEEIEAAPDVNYFELGYEATRTCITLNQINETYWRDWADNPSLTPPEIKARTNLYDIDPDGTIHVDGIDRALRKALSYAYNYTLYIEGVLDNRAIRHGGFLGVDNEFYNPNIGIAYQNLTIARQTLIDDPYWGPKVAARELYITNSTEDWIWVANNDPIFEMKVMYEEDTEPQASVFATSIKDIGLRVAYAGGNLNPNPPWFLTDIYEVMIMSLSTFPAFTYHAIPTNWPDANIGSLPVIEYYYKSPGLPYVNGSGLAWPGEGFVGGQFFNIGFHYNATIDRLIEKAWFSDRTTTQEIMNKITKHVQTYQYPEIFISHNVWGFAIEKEWQHNPIRGAIFSNIKYLPAGDGDGGVQIPGFQTVAILAITIVTITGIGYSLNRKRRRAEK
jgi:ABC-type transport system substrate-binding protein